MATSAAGAPFKARIVRKLTEGLNPIRLKVSDVSHLHAHHRAMAEVEGGAVETHFNIEVVSEAFNGQSLIKRQRAVYQLLADELKERVHALQMSTRTPEEDSKKAAKEN